MLPILLIPGLNCSATLFANQIPPLWRFGSVVIANHTCGETVGAIAQEILKTAPPRFTLIGFSMGGYIAFEILRQAGERIARIALIDTGARADTAQQVGAAPAADRDGSIGPVQRKPRPPIPPGRSSEPPG